MILLMSPAAFQPPWLLPSLQCSWWAALQSVSLLQRGCRPVRAGGKMHTVKSTQLLWGREIWLQERRKSPDFLISLATAVCACSLPPPRPVGWRWGMWGGWWGDVSPRVPAQGWWGQCRDAPINNTAAVRRALLFQWVSPDSVIRCRKLCLTSCFIRLFPSTAVHG